MLEVVEVIGVTWADLPPNSFIMLPTTSRAPDLVVIRESS